MYVNVNCKLTRIFWAQKIKFFILMKIVGINDHGELVHQVFFNLFFSEWFVADKNIPLQI